MRKICYVFLLAILLQSGCDMFEKEIDYIRNDIEVLQERVKDMNLQLSQLQLVLQAVDENALVRKVTPIKEFGVEVGFMIEFSNDTNITIYHGKEGNAGYTPQISVKQYNDGIWYWAIDGEYLLDGNGKKIKAAAEDGEDAVSPQVKIENGYWYISVDGGRAWTETGVQATGDTGAPGNDGVSFFEKIDYTSSTDYVLFTLKDGTQFKLHTWSVFLSSEDLCNQMNNNIAALDMIVSRLSTKEPVRFFTVSYDGSGKTAYELTYVDGVRTVMYRDNTEATSESESEAPVIGLKATENGYVWTLGHEVLKDDIGNAMTAGEGGIAPKLLIKDSRWLISTDGRTTWKDYGPVSELDADIMLSTIDNISDPHSYSITMNGGNIVKVDKYKEIIMSYSYSEDIPIRAGANVNVDFNIQGGWGEAVVSTMATNGWQASINMTGDRSGTVIVTAPDPYTQNEVTLFVNCDGQIVMSPLTFKEDIVPVDTLELSDSEITIYNKYSKSLTAMVYPEIATHKEVIWTSSDEDIVVVGQNGRVTARNVGKAIVTARAGDKSADCIVNVIQPFHLVTNVTISSKSLKMEERTNYRLWASILPTNATNKEIEWLSSDPETASVNQYGTVTAHKPGKVQITAESGEVMSACDVEVTSSTVVNEHIDFDVKGVKFRMVKVEAGSFIMGSENSDNEKPVHNVTLSNDYYIGETEVTYELVKVLLEDSWEWSYIIDKQTDPNCPVTDFHDDYLSDLVINRLNQITGQKFRLPTEAEWEFAAKGGNKSKGYHYSGSDDVNEVAWYGSNSTEGCFNPSTGFPQNQVHPVKSKRPNELGIYDMSGNACEKCSDWYGIYPAEDVIDPTGRPFVEGWSSHLYRGGCATWGEWECRTTARYEWGDLTGIRLAL